MRTSVRSGLRRRLFSTGAQCYVDRVTRPRPECKMWLHGTQPCRRELALGKQIGEYSGKLTSLTWEDGPGTATTSHGNIEGTVTGELGEGTDALTQTAVAEAGAQSGTWSQVGFVGMQDGTGGSFRANGTCGQPPARTSGAIGAQDICPTVGATQQSLKASGPPAPGRQTVRVELTFSWGGSP